MRHLQSNVVMKKEKEGVQRIWTKNYLVWERTRGMRGTRGNKGGCGYERSRFARGLGKTRNRDWYRKRVPVVSAQACPDTGFGGAAENAQERASGHVAVKGPRSPYEEDK